jgi:hypothetical protein
MKTSKLALVFLTCTTGSVFAQDNSPYCVNTNYDQTQDMFTVINPAPGALNQQCFLTVHPAPAPGSARPDGLAGRFVEGEYEILLGGGGGGGGGGGASEEPKSKPAGGGKGGAGALPARTVQHLSPGVYRLTIGTGGKGGGAAASPGAGENAAHGNPTGVAEAYTGQTIAGFPRAEMWAGYSAESYEVAAGGRRIPSSSTAVQVHDGSGPGAINGSDGQSRDDSSQPGADGGHGFIKMTLVAQAAPQAATPATPPPAAAQEQAPAPKPVRRPIKKDRN